MAKTLAALYKDTHTAQQVFEALLETGFSGDDISLIVKDAKAVVATPDAFSSGDGAGLGALVGALVGIGSALVPGIGPLIGSGPIAVAVTAGIGAAAGALTGGVSASLIELDLDEEETRQHETAQREGGTVVSVTSNEDWLEWAERIMARYHPIRIEEREAKWYTSGWASSSDLAIPVQSQAAESEASSPRNSSIKRMNRVQIYDN